MLLAFSAATLIGVIRLQPSFDPLWSAAEPPLSDLLFGVVDVETTGIVPARDAVVEIAASLYRGSRRIASFESLVDPGRPIPAAASGIHHITNHDTDGAPDRADAVRALAAFLRPAQALVAHNAAFDRAFLPELIGRPWLCTLQLARRLWPEADNHKNQTLRYHLGLDPGLLAGTTAHRALADTRVTGEIFVRALESFRARSAQPTLDALIAFASRTDAAPATVAAST